MTAVYGVFALVGAEAKKQSGFPSIMIFVVIGAAFYFLIYRPQQRKQKLAKAVSNAFSLGDEVVTAGGIVGYVIDITDDRVTLETSVGASFVVLRPYVLRKIEPTPVPNDVVGESEADDDTEASTEGSAPVPPPPPGAPEATGDSGTSGADDTEQSEGPDSGGANGPKAS